MFSFFKKSPKDNNLMHEDLARMFYEEKENPIYLLDFLMAEKLDYSLESLKHVDEYLEQLYKNQPSDDELLKITLRTGSYVGEVIRKNTKEPFVWLNYEEATKINSSLTDFGENLGTVGMLWSKPDSFIFPLAKILKFIENGNEDSVHSFANVAIAGMLTNT